MINLILFWVANGGYHARMARRAQHLCERSERADNKLDKNGEDLIRVMFGLHAALVLSR